MPRISGGEELPRHPSAEAESDDGQLAVGIAPFELVEPRLQVGDQPFAGRVAERGLGVALAGQAGGATFGREQVDGQGVVPVGSQARRDRADVWRQSPVLVDHENGAVGRFGGRVHADEIAVLARGT